MKEHIKIQPTAKLEQRLSLTPSMRQALRLLQMGAAEVEEEVNACIERNPFLDTDNRGDSAVTEGLPVENTANQSGEIEVLLLSTPEEEWYRDNTSGGNDIPAISVISLREHLQNQIPMLRLSDKMRQIVNVLIDSLDERGYLVDSEEILMKLISSEHPLKRSELRQAILLLQTLDPPGIAASSLQESFVLQLQVLPNSKARDNAILLCENHFTDLKEQSWGKIRRHLGCNEIELQEILAILRRLVSAPGRLYATEPTTYINPDVIVIKVGTGRWTTAINMASVPRVRLDTSYMQFLEQNKTTDGVSNHHLRTQAQEAQDLIKHVRSRYITLLRTAQAIVHHQIPFMESGDPSHIKPLLMRTIATELNLNEGTISRTVSNKYMRSPHGIFEFRYFFSNSLQPSDKDSYSSTAVQSLILDYLREEDPRAPLSDDALCMALNRRGIHISRRTVTKYRDVMNIPTASQRRRHNDIRSH